MKPANRVIFNTGFLYGKMLITMIIAFYSTRLVLNALGTTDYGVFSLVGGVIAMLSFLNAAMTTSTQRYLSFYIGASDNQKLKSIFSSSVLLHLIIGLIVVLVLESGGIFLFHKVLHIPAERIDTAKVVFHFMVISTFFTINAVPYDAAIITHENFLFDALLGIIESLFKLGIAIWLNYVVIDKLIIYGFLIALLTIFIRIIKSVYCFKKYEECKIHFKSYINISLIKEMLSFAGWNLFGTFCTIIRDQGLAIILNMFFGIIINAAYAIANQVDAQLTSFSINLLRPLNPQIVKSEGGGDRERMLRLSMLSCKLSFLLYAFYAIPLILEMSFVLNIWLKVVPENAVLFCQLFLILTLIQLITYGLSSAVQSVGRIKAYQATVGSLLILNLPISYLLIKLGYPVYSVFVSAMFLEFIAGVLRIWFAYKVAGLNFKYFVLKVLFKSLLAVSLVTLISLLPRLLLEEGFLRIALTILVSIVSFIVIGKYIALSSNENEKIKELIKSIISKTQKLITNKIYD